MQFFLIGIKKEKAMRILVLSLLLIPSMAACRYQQIAEDNRIFDGDKSLQLVAEQLAIGPRFPGSPEIEVTRQWIEDQVRLAGWISERQCFDHQGIEVCNIIASPKDQVVRKGEWIILGAHYDTRRYADRDLTDPSLPVPGANDGASGVAVLLELARVIQPEELKTGISLYFFDAEDQGGINGWDWSVGAAFAAQSLDTDPSLVVIVDMVGDRDLQIYRERKSSPELKNEIWTAAAELGFTGFLPEIKYTMIDDHVPFMNKGIPAVEIIDFDYAAWHTTGDTLDQVSAESLFQVGRTLQAWLERR
jgi:glutaminyl-peptide cyclotransferase